MSQRRVLRPLDHVIIVIVDDNRDHRAIVPPLLRKLNPGFCQAVASGQKLFELLDSYNLIPDLILLDLHLPHQDGYDILKAIRARPALQRTRVIAMTAYVTETEQDRISLAGFDGLIGKPIDIVAFPSQVRAVLEGERVWVPYSD